MKRFLKGFLCGMLTTSMMLVVALTVGQFSGYIDLGAAWNRTDQDSTMKREVKQKASTIEKYIDAYYFIRPCEKTSVKKNYMLMTSIKIRWKILYTKES